MIGDRKSDIQIGLNSSVTPICIQEKAIAGFEQVPTFATLTLAVEYILGQEQIFD